MDSRSAGSSETTVPPRRSIRIRNKALLQTLPRELKHDPLAYSVDHKALRNAVGRKRKSPDAAAAKAILETLSLPWMLDRYEETPLHWAALYGNRAVIMVLFQHGATALINFPGRYGFTPLNGALSTDQSIDIVEMFLAAGADPTINNDRGVTPLHWAAFRGDHRMASLLAEHGADPSAASHRDCRTPLHLAAAAGKEDIVRLLLRIGSNPLARTNLGKTPLQVSSPRNPVIQAMLRDAEIDAVQRRSLSAPGSRSARSAPVLDRGQNRQQQQQQQQQQGPQQSWSLRRVPLKESSPEWVPDESSETCMQCRSEFGLFNRRHHCRNCGKLCCDDCSSHRLDSEYLKEIRHQIPDHLPHLKEGIPKLGRICNNCFDHAIGRFDRHS